MQEALLQSESSSSHFSHPTLTNLPGNFFEALFPTLPLLLHPQTLKKEKISPKKKVRRECVTD